MSELEREIRDLIVSILFLEDVRSEDFDAETRLFDDDGLGLDSIDALEIGVAVQKTYGVKINKDDPNVGRYFQSVRTLADFVAAHRAPVSDAQ